MTCLGLLLAGAVLLAFDMLLAQHLWRRDRKNEGEDEVEMSRRMVRT